MAALATWGVCVCVLCNYNEKHPTVQTERGPMSNIFPEACSTTRVCGLPELAACMAPTHPHTQYTIKLMPSLRATHSSTCDHLTNKPHVKQHGKYIESRQLIWRLTHPNVSALVRSPSRTSSHLTVPSSPLSILKHLFGTAGRMKGWGAKHSAKVMTSYDPVTSRLTHSNPPASSPHDTTHGLILSHI